LCAIRLWKLDANTARLQLPSRGWRLYRAGVIGELRFRARTHESGVQFFLDNSLRWFRKFKFYRLAISAIWSSYSCFVKRLGQTGSSNVQRAEVMSQDIADFGRSGRICDHRGNPAKNPNSGLCPLMIYIFLKSFILRFAWLPLPIPKSFVSLNRANQTTRQQLESTGIACWFLLINNCLMLLFVRLHPLLKQC